jgi:hypothetical protein
MTETKTYYRVESYEGCAMTPSGRFESREDADEYARTHPAADARVVKVNEAGAAMITKYKGVVCAACGKFWSIGPTYLVERPEQIGADLSLDNDLTCPYCRDTCTYFTSDVVHSVSADGKDPQYQIPRLA